MVIGSLVPCYFIFNQESIGILFYLLYVILCIWVSLLGCVDNLVVLYCNSNVLILFYLICECDREGIIATGAADDAIRFFVESKDGLVLTSILPLIHQIPHSHHQSAASLFPYCSCLFSIRYSVTCLFCLPTIPIHLVKLNLLWMLRNCCPINFTFK